MTYTVTHENVAFIEDKLINFGSIVYEDNRASINIKPRMTVNGKLLPYKKDMPSVTLTLDEMHYWLYYQPCYNCEELLDQDVYTYLYDIKDYLSDTWNLSFINLRPVGDAN